MGKNKGKKQSHGIPEDFLEKFTEMFGNSLVNQLKATFVERPTTFRINTLKGKKPNFAKATSGKEQILEILQQHGFKIERVSWNKEAFILKSKTQRELTGLDIYNNGEIYVQSLASMVPPLVLDPQPGEKVLDLTAAPGSKTSQMAALMNKQGELVANDNNEIRFSRLKYNMEILGVSGDGFLKLSLENGATLFQKYPEYFDKILLDAPCSAEARFVDGEPATYGYWKEKKVKEMYSVQKQLLSSAWDALKPGGILVYSTCTFSPEENELQITRFIEKVGDCELLEINLPDLKRLPILKTWHGQEINKEVVKKSFRIMPTKDIEGFFVVKMRKKI